MKTHKSVILRLAADQLRIVREIARLSGQKVEVVVAVLLAIGTMKHTRDAAKKRKA